jgi:hypothetical protein
MRFMCSHHCAPRARLRGRIRCGRSHLLEQPIHDRCGQSRYFHPSAGSLCEHAGDRRFEPAVVRPRPREFRPRSRRTARAGPRFAATGVCLLRYLDRCFDARCADWLRSVETRSWAGGSIGRNGCQAVRSPGVWARGSSPIGPTALP